MPLVKIDRIIEAADPYSPPGKNYTVYQWKVDAQIDGTPEPGIKLSTLSGKAAKSVQLGW